MDIQFVGSESPPLRSGVLGFGASFLRGRPRAPSQLDTNTATNNANGSPAADGQVSPTQPRSPSAGRHRRRPGPGGNNNNSNNNNANSPNIQTAVSNHPTTPTSEAPPPVSIPSLGLGMLRRRRSGGVAAAAASSANHNSSSSGAVVGATPSSAPQPQIMHRTVTTPNPSSSSSSHRIRLVPHLDSRRTLRFEPISRNLKEGDPPLRIGRFTDRSGTAIAAANALSSNKLAFKSKVVSRSHAEIWVEGGGKFFIKDTKSSSGTFLNHVRLSPANSPSKPHQIKDGDILQLGVDYQGGTEDMYKSVKIRIEVGREWQAAANAFNTNALSQLKSLAVSVAADPTGAPAIKKPSQKSTIPDCCICLFSVTIRQALFIAPCSHAFHYKCIRPLLEAHASAFSCPLCRTFADLEEDVEIEQEPEEDLDADIPDIDIDVEEDDGIGGATHIVVPGSTAGLLNVRDRSREREGAETEVEADGHGSGIGAPRLSHRSRTRVHAADPDMIEGSEGEDADMLNASVHGHSHSHSHSHNRAGPSGAGADLSEGEGSGTGSGEGLGMAMDVGNGSGSGGEGVELTIGPGAKRKR
ncbi:hypothetical protein HWV62_789 [Athelia sp. TMB]|nr:hypothetical protein HWV62_15527 [Athelia sp. TMB]KAF7978394.1 hypothetical protein HWV62_789 [Athelia sp. TMB]